ncbi:MAG: 5-formyltetrahydrofolate cyclo-ligase, partial [Desulfobulbaceae bacterium]|nr:5-formyltetrahydrofolate cyclo-ligase [Desulfobulbaceae bacterium]
RQQLRRTILAARDAMPLADRCLRSTAVADRLWQLFAFANARTPFIYVHFRSEVETLPLIRQCLARGKQVAVPLTLVAEKRLDPYLITDPDRDLRPGYCGIPEPDHGRLKRLAPAVIDVVLLPGSVFDTRGGRLGYGGGYYDRFLATLAPKALRIGIAYELQVVERVPLAPHDQRLHYLVTEDRLIAIP